MKKPLLTISLLSSGRPDTLWKCLDSLKLITKRIESEVLITDTGCSAEVRKRMESYADRIFDFAWCDDFSAARNVGLKEARGEWFLFIDDDEYFTDVDEIVCFLNTREKDLYDSADYIQRNFLDPEGNQIEEIWVSRMKKLTAETRFKGRVHEYMVPENGPCKLLHSVAEHYGYALTKEEDRKKHSERNIVLLKKMLEEDPEEPRWYAQLLQDQYFARDYEAVCNAAEHTLLMSEGKGNPRYIRLLGYAYVRKLTALMELNRLDAAYAFGLTALEDQRITDLHRAELSFYLTGITKEKGLLAESMKHGETYLRLFQDMAGDEVRQMEQGANYLPGVFMEEKQSIVEAAVEDSKDRIGGENEDQLKVLGEEMELMPLEQWENGVRAFCSTHSLEEIDHKIGYLQNVLKADSLRLLYFRLGREISVVMSVGQTQISHGDLKERFLQLISAAEAYYGPYYTDEAFGEPDVLPPEYRCACFLARILDAEERGNVAGIKDLIEPCVRAMPSIKEPVLKYVKLVADEMGKEEQNKKDEMAYLAAQLKKKAKELQAVGQEEAAQQILEQLRALGQL